MIHISQCWWIPGSVTDMDYNRKFKMLPLLERLYTKIPCICEKRNRGNWQLEDKWREKQFEQRNQTFPLPLSWHFNATYYTELSKSYLLSTRKREKYLLKQERTNLQYIYTFIYHITILHIYVLCSKY